MEQFSLLNKFLNKLSLVFDWLIGICKIIYQFLITLLRRLWSFLRLKIPFLEAYIDRHVNNPATFFIDGAVLVLALYFIFGATGAYLVYGKKSESRFTEDLTVIYPLPAAKVNNSIVWSHHFLKRLRFLNTFNEHAPKDVTSRPPTDTQLRNEIMQGLIEDKIVLLESQKRGISVTETELNDAYNQQKSQNQDFEKKLQDLYGMSPQDFKEILAERILREKLKAAILTRIKVSHILTTTLDAANAAKKEIDSGKDFADVAKRYSSDSQTKDSGGDLGYWTKGELASQIDPSFENAAFGLNVGQVSGPIQTKFGYHLIKVTERTGDNLESYDDWLKQVRKNYKTTILAPI